MSAPAVVVAHGLWLPGGETWLLRRRLAQQGFDPYLFRYQTVAEGLEHNAAQLDKFAARLDNPVVHFVGYSLGGVISVLMLRRTKNTRIGRLVCMGSPLSGSAAARMLEGLPGGKRLMGRSIVELNKRAGVGRWEGDIEIGVVAGSLAFGGGRLMGALGAASDGTVAIAETKMEGIKAHIVRHVSHTSMMFSALVADDVGRFLNTGSFEVEAE